MIGDLRHAQQHQEHPGPDPAGEALRLRHAHVEQKAQHQYGRLDGQRDGIVVPQAQPHFRPARPEREVRHMDQEVQDPVGEDGRADDQPAQRLLAPRPDRIDEAGRHRPGQRARQGMGDRHVVEIERIGVGKARHDAHVLDPVGDE